METSHYSYYAFISYSHKDIKSAKWLQNALEKFKFPTKVKKDYGSRIPDNIRPIFRDETDLNGGVLEKNLERELLESRFLLVVCSPNSAKSEWVNKEVEFFINTGREDQIIPLIIEGKPDTDNEAEQCFVPALRNLGNEILGISLPALGLDKAIVKVVAQMLNLKFDNLWQRHERHKRKNRIIVLSLITSVLLALAGFGIYEWDYNREKVTYYADFVDQWGIPKGLFKLSDKQVAHRYGSYKFTESRGKLRKVEYVNPKGLLREPLAKRYSDYNIHAINPVSMELDYYGNGNIAEIVYKSSTQTPILAIQYHDKNSTEKVKIKQLKHEIIQEKTRESAITGLLFKRDSSGFVSRIMYLGNNDQSIQLSRNNVGVFYKRNDLGQVVQYMGVDKSSNLDTSAIYHVKYDSLGNIRQVTIPKKYASDASKRNIFNYDEYGNLTKNILIPSDYWDKNIFYKYDENGNLFKETYMTSKGEFFIPRESYDYASIQYEYDDIGRQIRKSYFDESNKPVRNKPIELLKYNKKGLVSQISFVDNQGGPVVTSNGYAKVLFEYDENDNLLKEQFLDEKDNLSEKNRGYAQTRTEYDSQNRVVKKSYFNASGNLTKNSEGYASYVNEYDMIGNLTKVNYLNEKGVLTTTNDDYASISFEYDGLGIIVKSCSFDTAGTPLTSECQWDSNINYRKAMRLYLSQQWEDAAKEFANILTKDPGYYLADQAVFYQANALAHLEKYDEAAAAYRQALKLYPSSDQWAKYQYNLLEIDYKKGNYKDVLARRRLISLFSKESDATADITFIVGMVKFQQKQYQEAGDLLETTLPGNANYFEARYYAAQANEYLGNLEKAKSFYQDILEQPVSNQEERDLQDSVIVKLNKLN